MSVKLWSSTILILLGHLSRYLIHINSCSNIISLRSHSHSGAITALTFSESGLISASEDCTICMWDVVNQVIIRRFNHGKGKHNLQRLFCLLLSFTQEGVCYLLGSVKLYVVEELSIHLAYGIWLLMNWSNGKILKYQFSINEQKKIIWTGNVCFYVSHALASVVESNMLCMMGNPNIEKKIVLWFS